MRRSPGHGPMTATMRLTGLGSGIDKDRPDSVSTVASGVLVASTRPAAVPTILRRFWSMTVNGPMTRSDRVATLEEASEIRSRPNRDFLQEFVRPHDLVRKVCNFSGSCSGAVSEELGMHGRRGGDRKEADDLHNPRNRRLFACLSMCAPRVLPPLWRGPRRPWMPKRQGLSAGTFVTIRL